MSELQNYCTVEFLYVKVEYLEFLSFKLYDFFRVGSSSKSSLSHKKLQISLGKISRY